MPAESWNVMSLVLPVPQGCDLRAGSQPEWERTHLDSIEHSRIVSPLDGCTFQLPGPRVGQAIGQNVQVSAVTYWVRGRKGWKADESSAGIVAGQGEACRFPRQWCAGLFLLAWVGHLVLVCEWEGSGVPQRCARWESGRGGERDLGCDI